MESWQWIFVFFAILMIARIVPRMIRGRKNILPQQAGSTKPHMVTESRPEQSFVKESRPEPPFVKESRPEPPFVKDAKPETKDMLVLGELNRGATTFGEIKKNTGLDSKELDSILKGLETRRLMRVEKVKGLLGNKIELYPTEKGFREYNS